MKEILVGRSAAETATKALVSIADAVGSTLGPAGQPAIVERMTVYNDQSAIVTKDGITVLRALGYFDPIQSAVLSFAKSAANVSVSESGDGTTSTIVLAAMVAKMVLENKTQTPQLYARSIRAAGTKMVAEVRKAAIKSSQNVRLVAKTSANGDDEIADIVTEAMSKVSAFGTVILEKSSSAEEGYSIESQEGYCFGAGYQGREPMAHSVNSKAKSNLEFDIPSPFFYLYNGDLGDDAQIASVVNTLPFDDPQNPVNLVLVAYGFEDSFVQRIAIMNLKLAKNGLPSRIYVVPVRMTPEQRGRLGMLYDIAAVTGGTVLDGSSCRTATGAELGQSDFLRTSLHKSIIIGRSVKHTIPQRAKENAAAAQATDNAFDRQLILSRNAEMTEGLVTLVIGGGHSASVQERYDRMEDALRAAQASVRGGVVPGAGTSYIRAALRAKAPQELLEAMASVTERILSNYGTPTTREEIIKDVASSSKNDCFRVSDSGVQRGHFLKLGVVDAADTVCAVIQNGIELGCMVATVGCYSLRGNLARLQELNDAKTLMTGEEG